MTPGALAIAYNRGINSGPYDDPAGHAAGLREVARRVLLDAAQHAPETMDGAQQWAWLRERAKEYEPNDRQETKEPTP